MDDACSRLSVSPFTICSPEPRLASLLHLPLLPLATHWTLDTWHGSTLHTLLLHLPHMPRLPQLANKKNKTEK